MVEPARTGQLGQQGSSSDQNGKASGGKKEAPRSESVSSIHSAAGGNLAADGGDSAGGHRLRSCSSRFPRCRKWTIPRFKWSRFIPARVPM